MLAQTVGVKPEGALLELDRLSTFGKPTSWMIFYLQRIMNSVYPVNVLVCKFFHKSIKKVSRVFNFLLVSWPWNMVQI